jgi:predicted transcriptional regulator
LGLIIVSKAETNLLGNASLLATPATAIFPCDLQAFILQLKHTINEEVDMDLLKEATIETIKRMPDGSTVEDIMREINFVAQVLEGIRDADAGRLISTEELLSRVEQWAK